MIAGGRDMLAEFRAASLQRPEQNPRPPAKADPPTPMNGAPFPPGALSRYSLCLSAIDTSAIMPNTMRAETDVPLHRPLGNWAKISNAPRPPPIRLHQRAFRSCRRGGHGAPIARTPGGLHSAIGRDCRSPTRRVCPKLPGNRHLAPPAPFPCPPTAHVIGNRPAHRRVAFPMSRRPSPSKSRIAPERQPNELATGPSRRPTSRVMLSWPICPLIEGFSCDDQLAPEHRAPRPRKPASRARPVTQNSMTPCVLPKSLFRCPHTRDDEARLRH